MRCHLFLLFLYFLLLCPLFASAQLVVTVSPPEIIGQIAVVKLTMKNNLTNKVESARAACFLLDGQGKMIGQSTKWIIGKGGLEPKGEATFNFVVSSHQSFTTTNLTAKVTFSRLNLTSGPVADLQNEVIVNTLAK
jgi:hypothetical protein